MAAERTGRVWEDARRALGRLIGRVSSYSLPEVQAGIAATVRHSTATQFAEATPGARQDEWESFAQVRLLPTLAATPGGGGIDPVSVVTVIGEDRALRSDTAVVVEAACRFAASPVRFWILEHDMPNAPAVQTVSVGFDGMAMREAGMIFGVPSVRLVTVARLALPKPRLERPPDWMIKPSRVRAGLAPILRIPILCRRLAAPPGGGAFAAERRLLATAAGAPDADVSLIGVFPHVPLGAVQKLSVASDGALQIWVRPDAIGRTAATVTVVLGRQRSTGKMLQAVRRGTGSERN